MPLRARQRFSGPRVPRKVAFKLYGLFHLLFFCRICPSLFVGCIRHTPIYTAISMGYGDRKCTSRARMFPISVGLFLLAEQLQNIGK